MKLPKADLSDHFRTLLNQTKKTMQDTASSAASLIVIHSDRIVLEWYNGFHHSKQGARQIDSESMFNIYSVRKTYVGLATAIAATEANVPLETPVYKFVHDISRDSLGGITIRDLATKTGAKYFGDSYKIEREELAGKVIENITGKNIAQLVTQRVFIPMQFHQTEWAASPKENLVCDFQADGKYASVRIESNEGHERNLYTSALDLAMWGYLHLNKGISNGRRIVPEAVFELYARLQLEDASKRLFGWYHQENWYYATGAAGCHCVVFPKHHAVGVRMLNRYTDNYKEDQLSFNSLLLGCLQEE